VRPLAGVAVGAAAAMLLLACTGLVPGTAGMAFAAVAFVLATTVSVADNGLAFTSVAEAAGTAWAGRALGAQNTAQFIGASLVGPGIGALVGLVGFPLAFALAALFPAVAVPLVPRPSAERDLL
jgi:MFS family permease